MGMQEEYAEAWEQGRADTLNHVRAWLRARAAVHQATAQNTHLLGGDRLAASVRAKTLLRAADELPDNFDDQPLRQE